MRRVSFIIILLLIAGKLLAQSPHGKNFSIDCAQCHNTSGWKVLRSDVKFDHNKTNFPLKGQHLTIDCNTCHTSLIFSEAKTDCASCHKDIHKNTVSKDCAKCHSPQSWLVQNVNSIHRQSRFPLVGNHQNLDCKLCHANYQTLSFDVKGIECYDCHRKDFEATKTPSHISGNFSKDCQTCHNLTNLRWSSVNTTHEFFPLTGGHAIGNCFSCHRVGNYTGLSKDCYSCHSSKYSMTSNPNHTMAKFSTTCSQCHTINSWKPSSFNHAQTNFILTGKHQNQSCNSCHASQYKGTSSVCYNCHKPDYDASKNPNHVSSKLPTTCEQCHSTNGWSPATFNHANTKFPLTGKHNSVACADCHKNGYSNTSADCYSCHQTKYAQTTNPSHIAANFPTTCEQCHSTNSWTPATFDHDGKYFPIYSGSHKNTWNNCAECHTTTNNFGLFSCTTCHEHNQVDTDKTHASINGYTYQNTACFNCHPTGSKTGSFNHNTTKFQLIGSHTKVACQQCHQSGYANTPMDCASCHKSSYNSSKNPNHTLIGISTDCVKCHTSAGWTPSSFTHAATAFVLSGKHLTAVCESCHKGKTTGTSAICFNCHKSNYDASTNPNHVASGFPNTCEQCHSTNGWSPASFNHASTKFPLVGSHTKVDCQKCHQNGYVNTPIDCRSCHQSSFDNSKNPNHVLVGISADCAKCHTPSAWVPSSFSHSATAFVLSGQHLNVKCEACHQGKTTGTSQLCNSCHNSAFSASKNPNHVQVGISTDCVKCHNSTAWVPSTFSHSATTFILTGKHSTATCESCHKGKTSGTSSICYNCHKPDYDASKNPNHSTGGFPTACEQCHKTSGWSPATFNHSTTPFVLTGAHLTVTCTSCHKTGYNVGQTPSACYGCHQAKFTATTNPNHVTAKFITACEQCHSTSAWSPATFNHSTTPFPLTGAHINVTCASCHKVGYNVGQTPNACYGCHQSDYTATTNPNHVTAKFPTTCEQCHSTNSWTPATFDHDGKYFPIYSGNHKGKWNTCADCHNVSSNYAQFECINCHEHNKTSTDKDHQNVRNYVYQSSACYTCHPKGKN